MAGGPSSSCRPDRLEAFGKITVGIAEAIGNRLHVMTPFISEYLAGCDPQYVVKDVSGAPDQMGGWGIRTSNLGHWTGDIAAGFRKADAHGGKDSIAVATDAAIQSRMPVFRNDQVLSSGATENVCFDWSKPGDPGQALLQALFSQGGAPGSPDPTTAFTGAKNVHDAMAKLGINVEGDTNPAAGAETGPDLGDWVLGGLSVAQTFASEWQQSKGLPTSDRLIAATGQAAANGIAVTAGILTAMALSGPAAPITGFVVGTALALGFGEVLSKTNILPKPDLNNPTQMADYSGKIDGAISTGTVDPATSAAIEQSAVNQARSVEGAPAGGSTTALNDLTADIKRHSPYQPVEDGNPGLPGAHIDMPGPDVMPGVDPSSFYLPG